MTILSKMQYFEGENIQPPILIFSSVCFKFPKKDYFCTSICSNVGIGRQACFRSMCLHGHAGSSPASSTQSSLFAQVLELVDKHV